MIVGPDHVWLPVFPAGSVAWNGDVLTLEGVQANAASAELGASVELTGGEGSIASSNVTVPPECEGVYDGVWHVTGT